MSSYEKPIVTYEQENIAQTEQAFTARTVESVPEGHVMLRPPTMIPWEKIQGVTWIKRCIDEDEHTVFVQNAQYTEAYHPEPLVTVHDRSLGRRILGLFRAD